MFRKWAVMPRIDRRIFPFHPNKSLVSRNVWLKLTKNCKEGLKVNFVNQHTSHFDIVGNADSYFEDTDLGRFYI